MSELILADSFSHVVSATWIAKGTLVVADQGQHRITLFDSTGRRVARFGRKGQGPGEFQMIRRVARCLGDSAIVSDFGSERLTVVGDTGIVRSISLPPTLLTAELVGCLQHVAVFVRRPDELPGKGTQWFPLTIFTLDLRTNQLQWKAALKGTEMTVASKVPAFFERPFGRRALVTADGNAIIHAQSDEAMVTLLGLERGSVRIPFDPGPPRRIRADDRVALIQREADELGDAQLVRMLRQVYAEAEWPETIPPVDRMLADASGGAWLRRTPNSADVLTRWIYLTATGLRDSVLVRREDRLLAMAGDRMCRVREEVDGTQSVVVSRRMGVRGEMARGQIARGE